MKKDIKLLVFDIDGTLINNKGEVLKENKKVIKDLRKNGYLVAICTGRTFNGHWWIREDLDLMGEDDFSITSTGAFIRKNSTGKAIVDKSLKISDIKDIISKVDGFKVQIAIHTRDIIFSNDHIPNEDFLKDKALVRLPMLKYDSYEELPKEIGRVCFSARPEILKDLEDKKLSDFEKSYKYMRNAPNISEILRKDAGKSNALKDLVKIHKISLENVMYFGDGANDVKSIKAAGIGVAMGNARDICKKVADYVIGDNNQPSIAKFIRGYLNIDE